MKEFDIDKKHIVFNGFDDEQVIDTAFAKNFLDYAEEHKEDKEGTIDEVIVSKADEKNVDIDIKYVQDKPKIERIRRITGYLTGDLSTWNNSKRHEVMERIKHI